MKQTEHDIQVACVMWFRYQYPNMILYAVPNGGHRNVIVAAKMKAEGVLSGVPDLCIPVSRKGFHGLYIELKAGKNKTTPNQEQVMKQLIAEGYRCAVCYSLDEFISVVNGYIL